MIAFGIVGPPEACIITGYKDGGEMLTGWNFFQEMPEFAGDLQYEPCGYFIKKNWYEHPETVGVMAIENQSNHIHGGDIESFKQIIKYAVDVMNSEKIQNRAAGFKAFDAWKNAILNSSEFPKNAPCLC